MNNKGRINDINIEFLEDLLKEVHDVVIYDLINNIGDSKQLISALKTGCVNDEGKLWIDEFNVLIDDAKTSLKESYVQLENEFNKLFIAWEDYKIEHGIKEG